LKTDINFPSTGIDISREERIQRCKIAYQEFSEINMLLQDLKNSGGLVGSSACDALKEICVMFN